MKWTRHRWWLLPWKVRGDRGDQADLHDRDAGDVRGQGDGDGGQPAQVGDEALRLGPLLENPLELLDLLVGEPGTPAPESC